MRAGRNCNSRLPSRQHSLWREGVCLAEAKILFVAGEGWEKGVVGLAASSISQMFYRPAVVLAQEGELLTGSARSIAGINLYEALCQAEHLYERFGGHEMAAGLTIKRENLAEAQRLVEDFLKEKYPDSVFVPVCQYDEEIALAQADIGLAEQLERMQPFGQENEEPRFFISGFSPLSIAAMGKNREHLKMQAADCASEILRFSAREEIELGGQYDFVASFSINEFRGEPQKPARHFLHSEAGCFRLAGQAGAGISAPVPGRDICICGLLPHCA